MFKKYAILIMVTLGVFSATLRAEAVKPFIKATADPTTVTSSLTSHDFEVLGTYTPYADTTIVVVTNNTLREAANTNDTAGFVGGMRVTVSGTEVSYTNPEYWGAAYRIKDVTLLRKARSEMAAVLGDDGQYGTGDKKLTVKDMYKYHYMFGMEYFNDFSELASYDTKDEAVAAVESNLAAGVGGVTKVYRLDTDNSTVFGVAMTEGCSGDEYIMSRVDHGTPKSVGHLPYEIMVTNDGEVIAMYARFRIAISWPHLPMIQSETGATFFNIMCAPNAIEEALINAAGGEL